MSWAEHADQTLTAVLENMVAEGLLAKSVGMNLTPRQVVDASRGFLLDVIRTAMPLARIMDASDLVLRADGPAVEEAAMKLSAVNWLTGTAERAIRGLSRALFDLASRDAHAFSRALDLRLTGFAPGSLYAGFAVVRPPSDLLDEDDEPAIATVKDTLHSLPEIPRLIEGDAISPAIRDVLPDPAKRDAAVDTLFRLAPTGRRGIDSIDISTPGGRSAALSPQERVTLKHVLDRPQLHQRKVGAFSGELREIDLDMRRFHLRNVANVGSIRCVIEALDRRQAKHALGEFVRVEGEYETDREGRPRLMVVRALRVLERAHQGELPT
ncbi:MAG TPA: hypothetical protein VEY50_09355 [Lysobacter sp.]|nr:hypothetical protein [Lysobacter sp.]